ncbi:hypothetical protein K469DRAFT_529642, partial [Zopfia rhizophila CBS 207.26]
IQIVKEHKWMIIFKIKYKLFKYLVILIGLTKQNSYYKIIINYMLREYLDVFIIVYLNNMLVYTNRI